MKKVILFLFIVGIGLCIKAQTHRLANGEPYDIFLSVRPAYIMPFNDLKTNYEWGAGVNFLLEYQFQEKKVSVGIELGYNYFYPTTYKVAFLPRKHLWSASQVPLTVFGNYYFTKNEKLKPYIGLGFGVLWGKYDYSLSTEANRDVFYGYYLRDYEGQADWFFGVVPRCGFMFSLDHRNAFGFELGYQHYINSGNVRIQTFTAALNYTYIID
jgi:opacity protein-like surface antigen